jgi:hypothetical protein
MIDPKSPGSSSEQKDDASSEQVQRTLKGPGKEIQRAKPGRTPLFRREGRYCPIILGGSSPHRLLRPPCRGIPVATTQRC